MKCGNGSERTQHPFELFGEDWRDWGHDFVAEVNVPVEDIDKTCDSPKEQKHFGETA
jgi:hypothetical protein